MAWGVVLDSRAIAAGLPIECLEQRPRGRGGRADACPAATQPTHAGKAGVVRTAARRPAGCPPPNGPGVAAFHRSLPSLRSSLTHPHANALQTAWSTYPVDPEEPLCAQNSRELTTTSSGSNGH